MGNKIGHVVGHVFFGWSCRLKRRAQIDYLLVMWKQMIARKQELVM